MLIKGWPDESLPSVFSVGPGPRMTYGTDTSTLTAIAAAALTEAMNSIRERRDMVRTLRAEAGDQGVPTHSPSPSAKSWCFQIGTEALSPSISARQASKASQIGGE